MNPRLSHQRNRALTLTDVIVVVFGLFLVLLFLLLALPAVNSPKSVPISCISNLKQIGIAYRLWEEDNNGKYPMAVSVTNGGAMELIATGNVAACFQVMSNELSTPKILLCPADTRRVWATNFSTLNSSNISYFVNQDAVETYPQMILDGDDNLLVDGKPVQPGILNFWTNTTIVWTKDRHHGNGNIGFADGHVNQVTSHGLNTIVADSVATNRWLIP